MVWKDTSSGISVVILYSSAPPTGQTPMHFTKFTIELLYPASWLFSPVVLVIWMMASWSWHDETPEEDSQGSGSHPLFCEWMYELKWNSHSCKYQSFQKHTQIFSHNCIGTKHYWLAFLITNNLNGISTWGFSHPPVPVPLRASIK